MKIGAIYIITRDARYMELLVNSAASLKRVMPDLPITVFSQFPLESSVSRKSSALRGPRMGSTTRLFFSSRLPTSGHCLSTPIPTSSSPFLNYLPCWMSLILPQPMKSI